MREKLGLSFPVLIDPDGATARSFGVWNEDSGKVPYPSTVVIDRGGTIRWLRVDEDYRVRPEHDEILAALEDLE